MRINRDDRSILLMLSAQLMSVDKWLPLCLLASFFTENPSFPALHLVCLLSDLLSLLEQTCGVHGLRGRWANVFSKWGITNPAEVWDNRKVYGTEAGGGTKQVRWVNFFQGASSAVEPIDIYTGISSWPYRRLLGTRRSGSCLRRLLARGSTKPHRS